jgi:hypothetical protein
VICAEMERAKLCSRWVIRCRSAFGEKRDVPKPLRYGLYAYVFYGASGGSSVWRRFSPLLHTLTHSAYASRSIRMNSASFLEKFLEALGEHRSDHSSEHHRGEPQKEYKG